MARYLNGLLRMAVALHKATSWIAFAGFCLASLIILLLVIRLKPILLFPSDHELKPVAMNDKKIHSITFPSLS